MLAGTIKLSEFSVRSKVKRWQQRRNEILQAMGDRRISESHGALLLKLNDEELRPSPSQAMYERFKELHQKRLAIANLPHVPRK